MYSSSSASIPRKPSATKSWSRWCSSARMACASCRSPGAPCVGIQPMPFPGRHWRPASSRGDCRAPGTRPQGHRYYRGMPSIHGGLPIHGDSARGPVTGMRDGKRDFGLQIEIRCWDTHDARRAFPTRLDWETLENLSLRILDIPGVSASPITSPPSRLRRWRRFNGRIQDARCGNRRNRSCVLHRVESHRCTYPTVF